LCNAEVKQADPSLAEDAFFAFVNRGGGLLLIGGLVTLGACWYLGNGQGIVGGGFLAVVGAILVNKK